jgi:hypothetical protein
MKFDLLKTRRGKLSYLISIKNDLITFDEYKNKMSRIEEIKKRFDKSDNVLLFDKHELDSLKKVNMML